MRKSHVLSDELYRHGGAELIQAMTGRISG